jgi:hypothetical protein
MLNINIKVAAARVGFLVISRELGNSIDQQMHAAATLMLDMNTVNKQTSLLCTIDIQPNMYRIIHSRNAKYSKHPLLSDMFGEMGLPIT